MRALRRFLIVVVAVVSAFQAPLNANDLSGGGASAYVNERGNPTATATDRLNSPLRPSSSQGTNCEWRVVNQDDKQFGVFDSDGERLYSETGRWLERWCEGRQAPVGDEYVVPETRRRVEPRALAVDAVRSVRIAPPEPATSPSADQELYTRVPTWLWLEEDWWREYRATASAGSVTSTVLARPVRAVWSTGDGGTTTCEGPGVTWQRGMAESATDCSYEYRHSSTGEPGGTYTLSVTVHFEVGWSSNVDSGGALPGITRSASRQVRVGEIQAIETG